MKDVLIISYWFPPHNTVASLRIYAFAKYLREYGYSTTVLTTRKNEEPGSEGPLDVSGITVVEIDFGVSGQIARLNCLRQQSGGLAAPLKYLRSLFWGSCERLKNSLLGNLFTPEDMWFFSALKKAKQLCAEKKFDIVISSSGPITCHFMAYALKRDYPAMIWCADYRDMWSYNDLFKQPKWPLSVLQRELESFVNSKADCISTVSEPLRQILTNRYGGVITVVENGYFPEDLKVSVNSPHTSSAEDVLEIVHTGTIYSKYRIEPLLQALLELIIAGRIARNEIRIRFYGDNNFLLSEAVQKYGMSDICQLSNKVSREQSLLIQKKSAGLLFLGHETVLTKGVLTGKLFEYIITGRPIIAIGITNQCSAGELIEKAKTGYVCGDDIGKIKSALMNILNNEPLEPDADVIEQYSRDKLVYKLVQTLESLPGQCNGSI